MDTSEILSRAASFIENGNTIDSETVRYDEGSIGGVIEILRHRTVPVFIIAVRTTLASLRLTRYNIRRKTFDRFGLVDYCSSDRDVINFQIVFSNYDIAYDFCCDLCERYREDKRLLNPRGSNFFFRTIPDELLEILDGAIAGDGGVYDRKHPSSSFQYVLEAKQRGHIEEFRDELAKFGYSGKIREYWNTYQYGSHLCVGLTWSLEVFQILRKRWYDGDRRKKIPDDLKNSPTFWRWFYAGDGCLYVLSPFSYRILIASNDFSVEDVDKFILMLAELGIKSKRYFKRNSEKTGIPQWIISIQTKKDVDRFLDYIGKPVKSIEYKWIRPIAEPRTCKGCKISFIPTRNDNEYCTVDCLRLTTTRRYKNKKKNNR